MPTDHRAALANIKAFPHLIAYLRDEMGWPIARDSFEDVDDLFYDFTADELGIDPKTAAKITEIKRLKPLSTRQPLGIFFFKFEPKKLPVVARRRILSQVAQKKRASANSADCTAWAADALLFVSNYGEGSERAVVETKRRLRPGMFVAQVVGKSMEPAIPDGAYCLFAAPALGTRQGKTVLVQLRDTTDPESGERHTVKRYESEKAQAGDFWRHEKIPLKPVNPDFQPITLTGADEGQLQVVAELVEVLGP